MSFVSLNQHILVLSDHCSYLHSVRSYNLEYVQSLNLDAKMPLSEIHWRRLNITPWHLPMITGLKVLSSLEALSFLLNPKLSPQTYPPSIKNAQAIHRRVWRKKLIRLCFPISSSICCIIFAFIDLPVFTFPDSFTLRNTRYVMASISTYLYLLPATTGNKSACSLIKTLQHKHD